MKCLEPTDLRCHINHDCNREKGTVCEFKVRTDRLREIIQEMIKEADDGGQVLWKHIIERRFGVLFK